MPATLPADLPPALGARIADRLDRIAARGGVVAQDWRERWMPVLVASEFAWEVIERDSALGVAELDALLDDAAPPASRMAAAFDGCVDDADAMRRLRRFRRRESLRLVARDVLGLDDVDATLAGATALAECCIEWALAWIEPGFEARFGQPRRADGTRQRMVVFGMGKLGGGELNFSSDIDLVFAYAEPGTCVGGRALDHEDYYTRLGQRLITLLAEVDADGFCFRVDMRLRPFGSVGRMALPFVAMEQYYQRDGRDWERYAWVKARPVAGDIAAGHELLATLRAFVYRRYLDWTAIDGLREMKRLIEAEVNRRELADHVKLGPGGIREIEFLVQLIQLTRGGREAALRTPSLVAAAGAAIVAGHLEAAEGTRLLAAYRFLRRIENRLQMVADAQTHALPDDDAERVRIALGLGYPGWDALVAALTVERGLVADAFARVLAAPGRAAPAVDGGWAAAAWQALSDGGDTVLPVPYTDATVAVLKGLARATQARPLDARARGRLDRLVAWALTAAQAAADADAVLARLVALFQAVLGRPTYLALLDEREGARERLVQACARSRWVAARVAEHPLLLDELLDPRVDEALPTAATLRAELARGLAEAPAGDVEAALMRIDEFKQGALFGLALVWLKQRSDPDALAERLADVAAVVLDAVTRLAAEETVRAHGRLGPGDPLAGFAVLGYGSFGGAELGFGSDLDLVFVFDPAGRAAASDGARPLEPGRWYARLAQRIVHWLTTPVRVDALYAVDTRLRPDGSKGLLVTTLESFADYQRTRAWTWEHQALVRARLVAGDPALAAPLAALRRDCLALPRARATLDADVASMRARWRAKLDRSDATHLDLKQGPGGLVDLEFGLQHAVLAEAPHAAETAWPTRTRELIDVLARRGTIDTDTAAALVEAHGVLLARALDCTLDQSPRRVPRGGEVDAAAQAIAAWYAARVPPTAADIDGQSA
jgi:glutamate-ammonia-ligase adenylyltransferase